MKNFGGVLKKEPRIGTDFHGSGRLSRLNSVVVLAAFNEVKSKKVKGKIGDIRLKSLGLALIFLLFAGFSAVWGDARKVKSKKAKGKIGTTTCGGFVFLLIVILSLLSFSTALGGIITVDDDGVADFNNVQAAIDDANDGDEVVVQPGTYTGEGNRDIDFSGKAITVRSTDPNNPVIVAATVIDSGGTYFNQHRGFYFHSGEDANSVLLGLTITKGSAGYGGGIYCYSASQMIEKCMLV